MRRSDRARQGRSAKGGRGALHIAGAGADAFARLPARRARRSGTDFLRKAFDQLIRDPEFIATAEKAGIDLDPVRRRCRGRRARGGDHAEGDRRSGAETAQSAGQCALSGKVAGFPDWSASNKQIAARDAASLRRPRAKPRLRLRRDRRDWRARRLRDRCSPAHSGRACVVAHLSYGADRPRHGAIDGELDELGERHFSRRDKGDEIVEGLLGLGFDPSPGPCRGQPGRDQQPLAVGRDQHALRIGGGGCGRLAGLRKRGIGGSGTGPPLSRIPARTAMAPARLPEFGGAEIAVEPHMGRAVPSLPGATA